MKTFELIIKNGGVAVIKTDTLYGLVASANNRTAVNNIYHIKKRNPLKPCIVLVSSIRDIKDMGFNLSHQVENICEQKWPGPVSIIIDAPDDIDLHYLHRGTGGIAFRIPADTGLRKLLKKTGPLVAPSANREGDEPAKDIKQAMKYFGDEVEYYMDGGICVNTKPSSIIRIHNDGHIHIIRE